MAFFILGGGSFIFIFLLLANTHSHLYYSHA